MTKKKRAINTNPLFVMGGILALLVVIFIAASHDNDKSMVSPTPTPQEQEGQGHAGYEEPKEANNISIVDIIAGGEIEQKTIMVRPNVVIAFKNEDKVSHQVISDSTGEDAFDTGIIKPGEQLYVAQYKTPGTYTYYVKLDPSKKGTIVVKN